MVHISVTNNSEFYCDKFIKIFQKLKHPDIKCSDKKCIEPLSTLIFKLDEENFKNLHIKIFQDEILIDLVFISIYDKDIYLYLYEIKMISATIKNKMENFRPRSLKRLDRLKRNFSQLFSILVSTKSNILNKLKDSIIDEKNAPGTFQLLTDIYGQCVKNLDFSDDIVNVKYCFNYYFLKSLTYQDLHDVSGLPVFCRLLFYIRICDDAMNTKRSLKDNKNQDENHKQQTIKLKQEFLRVQK
ncbi:unnamed protein product, partial [Didymodactylos carnosus]